MRARAVPFRCFARSSPQAIVKTAHTEQADVLVMGTVELNDVKKRQVLGSVVMKIGRECKAQ